jgi:hypothetical protein
MRQAKVVQINGASKPTPRKKPAVKLNASDKRMFGQFIAAVAAGFLPIASYMLAHQEVKTQPMLWILVLAALVFSAPTLATWAKKWCGGQYKAWGFTILLEGVMVCSQIELLSVAGLIILIAINGHSAWVLAGAKLKK